jgi:hypothetical protein
MVSSITRIQSPHHSLLNTISLCYYHSQISELCHIFVTPVSYLYVIMLPCILVTRQQHTLSFLYVYLYTNLLTSVNSHFCAFLYFIYVIIQYIHIISIDQQLMCPF